MATYMYKCRECGAGDSIDQPMTEDTPATIKCPACGKDMKRDILGEQRTTSIIIPDHMTATEVNRPQYKYDKSPSRKKHYF